MPVSTAMNGGIEVEGLTSVWNSPITSPPRTFTAPISVMSQLLAEPPVVSRSTTTNVTSRSGRPSSSKVPWTGISPRAEGATADTLRTVGARSDRSPLPRRAAGSGEAAGGHPAAHDQAETEEYDDSCGGHRHEPGERTGTAGGPAAAVEDGLRAQEEQPGGGEGDGHADAVADDEHDAEPRAAEGGGAEQYDESRRTRHQPAGDAHAGEC